MLLDIDGTLVDSNDKHTDCWVEAFAHFGRTVDWSVIREQIGKGGDLLVPDTLNAREMRNYGKDVQEHRGELWKRKYMESVTPFPGVIDSIRHIHARGIQLALASSASDEEVEYYVGLLDAADLLETTTSKKDAQFSKPSPEIFQAALDRLDADPQLTLVVGDTPYDILAAHRIALPVVAVRTGGFAEELLAKAEFVFEDLNAMTRELDRVDDYFNE